MLTFNRKSRTGSVRVSVSARPVGRRAIYFVLLHYTNNMRSGTIFEIFGINGGTYYHRRSRILIVQRVPTVVFSTTTG